MLWPTVWRDTPTVGENVNGLRGHSSGVSSDLVSQIPMPYVAVPA